VTLRQPIRDAEAQALEAGRDGLRRKRAAEWLGRQNNDPNRRAEVVAALTAVTRDGNEDQATRAAATAALNGWDVPQPAAAPDARKLAEEEIVRLDLLAEAKRRKAPVTFVEWGPSDPKGKVFGYPAVRVRYKLDGKEFDQIYRVERGAIQDATETKGGRYWRELVKGVEPFLDERPPLKAGAHYGPPQTEDEKAASQLVAPVIEGTNIRDDHHFHVFGPNTSDEELFRKYRLVVRNLSAEEVSTKGPFAGTPLAPGYLGIGKCRAIVRVVSPSTEGKPVDRLYLLGDVGVTPVDNPWGDAWLYEFKKRLEKAAVGEPKDIDTALAWLRDKNVERRGVAADWLGRQKADPKREAEVMAALVAAANDPNEEEAIRVAVTAALNSRKFGAPAETLVTVSAGLEWLALHQCQDGRWSMNEFHKYTREKPWPAGKIETDKAMTGMGTQNNDVAATALALRAFLAAGQTHKAPKEDVAADYSKGVGTGLSWLIKQQGKDGSFPGGIYAHGIATLAVCEAYGLTSDPNLKAPAQAALDYIVSFQHAEGGGWRYNKNQPGDMSVTGWMVQALVTGKRAGLAVPDKTLRGAERFIDSCEDPNHKGCYSYVPGGGRSYAMTATGMLCRLRLGADPRNPKLLAGVEFIKTGPPGRTGDLYYEYYATQVMHHMGGDTWDFWNEGPGGKGTETGIRDTLIAAMEKDKDRRPTFVGSWYFSGGHTVAGGRIMSTSLALLCLQTASRPAFDPVAEAARQQEAAARQREAEAKAAAGKAAAEMLEREAWAEAERAMNQMGLSEDEKRCVVRYVLAGLRRPPPLDFAKTEGWDGEGALKAATTVQRVIGPDEMLVANGRVRVKGVSTAGLAGGSAVDLDGLFRVTEVKSYVTGTGEKVKVPTIVLMDRKKVESALDSEEVKKWGDAKGRLPR
jgi:hypothetical protein